MAFLTAGQISRLAIELLSRRIVLPATVERVPGEEFAGPNGATVTISVPVSRTANIQSVPGATITQTAIAENSAEVSVVQLYDATRVTDHDLSLNIRDFGRQVLRPQVDSVARGLENQLSAEMNALAAEESFALNGTEADTEARILEAAEMLDDADVDPDNRFFAVSPAIKTRILSVPKFVRVNESGSSEALRRGIIGDLYGFTFVVSNALTGGTALAYHKSSFGFATFPPAEMNGGDAVQTSTVTEQGMTLRVLRQWNPTTLSRENVVTAFAGAGLVDGARVVKLDTAIA